ncbi:DUF4388 domain-containing protein [Herpetosiphon giganteus]|uniref:DUF4388 domain-containing protein n=1 Tax=Herpetosiphon giganteus TaxID=2029754 RepID=UPI00195686CD|nr:DUF4388 domain-containing protein [Herpetosiphon giganteus]MBM7842854.1 hypothetical protein [Herpetosiphon giganteus]
MALVGNLRDFALADFLYLIDRGYKTGSLQLNRQSAAATLYFEKGKLLYAAQAQERESLGEMLQRTGKLTPQQVQQAVQLQQTDGNQSLGTVLVEHDLITREDLQRHIQTHIEETVYSLFGWPDGEFCFNAGVKLDRDDVQSPVPLGVENLIMEGVRRVDEWGRIKDHIPNTDMIARFVDQPLEKAKSINLTPDEWRIFARINGKDSIKEVISRTGLSEFDVSRIVYGFISAGLVEVTRPRPPVPATGRAGAGAAAGAPKRSLVSRIINRIRGM